jgi:hypothetical protein
LKKEEKYFMAEIKKFLDQSGVETLWSKVLE